MLLLFAEREMRRCLL